MSSTNRSNARESHVSDYYVTPIYAIKEFLDEFIAYEPDFLHKTKFLDPCAGGDINHPMSYPKALKDFNIDTDTVDIREDSLANLKSDYLKMDCKDKYDVIITNPPFNIAINIVNKALKGVKDDGFVIMLLRLNFFGSKQRKQFWLNNMAKYAFVHSKRMSFTDKGGTDSIEYMHCVWQKGHKTDFVRLKVI